jgi:hypothetical protein
MGGRRPLISQEKIVLTTGLSINFTVDASHNISEPSAVDVAHRKRYTAYFLDI